MAHATRGIDPTGACRHSWIYGSTKRLVRRGDCIIRLTNGTGTVPRIVQHFFVKTSPSAYTSAVASSHSLSHHQNQSCRLYASSSCLSSHVFWRRIRAHLRHLA
ncbi:hypothetical protein CB0940_08383 [Cercospora beticola]|uniref:Uncharacterized protein n=1 Tax=Cercospora beticola TaxID=122368 RepID=A0A2G5HPK1_CERBT|nr:hypothetical protein CB0940_08383 [Cercospora beticola]PIA94152.1 hypothetical protein CB0940_08383 [Cercospora beticola]